jgi:hypothetical protein
MKEPGINPAIQETRQDNRQFLLVVSFFFTCAQRPLYLLAGWRLRYLLEPVEAVLGGTMLGGAPDPNQPD